MIKVSHEDPISLLEKSREFNDYEYALVHLFESHPEYYDFYKESVQQGRHVLLDNSIFELGKAFDSDKFATYVDELQPTEYIVPDVLENTNETINNFDKWLKKYNDLPGKKIGVVQGTTFQELADCYEYMVEHADKIAISFDYYYYQVTGLGKTKYHRYANGRRRLVSDLLELPWIKNKKPIHLLGCALPGEFTYYSHCQQWNKDYNWIESCDTSNPIVHGIKGIRYNDAIWGLEHKESTKLVDLLHVNLTDEQLEHVEHNLKEFRTLLNGGIFPNV